MRGHHIGKTTDPVEGCSYSSKYNVDLLVLGYIYTYELNLLLEVMMRLAGHKKVEGVRWQ